MKEGTMFMSSSLATNKEKKKKRMPLGKGRKKVAIKKIENKTNLQVCFSKRHRGLFSKAAEFSTLCGADVAVVAFSPGGRRVLSFGNPSADQVITRLLNHHDQSPSLNGDDQPQNMQEIFGEDDDDQEEELSFINEAMLQEKMDELRGIISTNTSADDHDSLAPLFNPFLASIGDLAMALAPAPALPFF